MGGRSTRPRVASRAVASFSIRFLGCKVSQTDAQELRERLLADGHVESPAGDVAVVNTCCVTHEAVRKSRHAVARAARTHTRVYVTGCGANLSGDAFAGMPENVTVVARPGEQTLAYGLCVRLRDLAAEKRDREARHASDATPARRDRPPIPRPCAG